MRYNPLWLAWLILLLAAGSAHAAASPDTARVVVAGGGLTETLYALGVQNQIVGVDTTSTWPPAARAKPQVGYMRALAVEGILSLSPTLVLTTDEAGPARALALVEAAGVAVHRLPAPRSANDVKRTIRALARMFDREQRGKTLIAELTTSLRKARQLIQRYRDHPRVLFVLGANAQLLAGGRDTAADAMIRLAGGRNAVSYVGYKPLTPEAAVSLAPQVILTVDYVIEEVGGRQALLAQPALALTPAARSDRVVVMSSLRLLGFGPRLGATVAKLARRLHRDTSHE
ncbi:MAG: ABC transporter substrate-binding protein [Nitrococcus sp.]|nr:ABC transporter substrate-binding protein [Nitrococcus sp.]